MDTVRRPQPREQVRERCRVEHYSLRAEQTPLQGERQPREMPQSSKPRPAR